MTDLIPRLSAWFARRRSRDSARAIREQAPDVGIGAEAPIRRASDDLLRRADFASRIASVLSELSLQEGRVFAIRGGWGFGKSSLKNLISERLDARSDGAEWLDFNPWQWGDGDMIARALFGQIADRLGGDHSKAALERADALRRYGAILTAASAPLKRTSESDRFISTILTNVSVIAVASAIGFDLPTVAKVAAALAIVSVAASVFGRLLTHFGRDRSAESLDKVRELLERRLRELERPLVVFVDDIDRLEPEQIRVVLRQVKANANLPNIVFVLLFQPSIVERALDPVADGDGRAFLEKIVQANFDLPAVPASIVHRIFSNELEELVGAYATERNGFSQTRWGNAFFGCVVPRLRHVRDARRLMSSISVHLPLHLAGEVFEVNIVDFLLLETLRVFEPDLHQAVFQERELVLQEHRLPRFEDRNEDKSAVERLLQTVKEERRLIAKEALKMLFPPLEWTFGGPTYPDGARGWLSAKRACTARYFPLYFELQPAVGEMSERHFVAFLEATATTEQLASVVADIEVTGMLPSLAVRLDESNDRLPIENASVLLPQLFGIAQKLARLEGASPFNSPWVSAWRATSWFVKRVPELQRGNLALVALRQTGALSVAAILIHLSDPADQMEGQEHLFDPVFDIDTVNGMKSEWLRLVRLRAAEVQTFIAEADLVSLLYRWRDYSNSLNEPREWVADATRTNEGFAHLVSRMMSRGASHSAGDRVSTIRNRFNKKTIEDFIGIDVAKARSLCANIT